jgi:hypothetical protein
MSARSHAGGEAHQLLCSRHIHDRDSSKGVRHSGIVITACGDNFFLPSMRSRVWCRQLKAGSGLRKTRDRGLKTIGLTRDERYFATTVISAVADLDASAVLVATK